MPGGDRTGPMGMGPMTGRGMGFCAGVGVPGFMNRGFGGWQFRGRRGGCRGFWNRSFVGGLTGGERAAMGPPAAEAAPAQFSPEQKLEVLEQQMENVSAVLEDIRQQIGEIKAAKSKS